MFGSILRGQVTGAERVQGFLDYSGHPDFDGRQHVLMNLQDFDFRNVFLRDLLALATRLHASYALRAISSRTSIFAPGDAAHGRSRMYQSMTEGRVPQETGVFRDIVVELTPGSPACAWVKARLARQP